MHTNIHKRKKKHIDIVLNENVEPVESCFDKYKLSYKAMPEVNLSELDLSTKFFDFDLSFPLIISSMTGGSKYSKTINVNIAKACQKAGIGFGLGSMRICLEDEDAFDSFDVKKYAPNVPMFANLGMVQLNYKYRKSKSGEVGYDEIMALVEKVKADGIFFHLNSLQEAVQPNGDTNYAGLFEKFDKVFQKLKKAGVNVAIKEVGHGIDLDTIIKLSDIGVEWIDVAGTSGTSWAWVEGYHRMKESEKMNKNNLGYIFRNEGISTDECLLQVKDFKAKYSEKLKNLNLIAGGGIRNGLHIKKAQNLGAKLATAAAPFLKPALESEEKVYDIIERWKEEYRIAMFVEGQESLKV